MVSEIPNRSNLFPALVGLLFTAAALMFVWGVYRVLEWALL